MAKVEVYYETAEHDLDLSGSDFHCAGYPIADGLDVHPLNKGNVVGIEVKYATRDLELKLVEDRVSRPLRGCVHREGSDCKLGKGICPVAGVESIKSAVEKLSRIKKLKLTTYATG